MVFSYVCTTCSGELDVERGEGDDLSGLERRMECPACGGRLRRFYTAGIVIPPHMRAGSLH